MSSSARRKRRNNVQLWAILIWRNFKMFIEIYHSTEGGTRSDTSFCHKFSLELHMLMCHNTASVQPGTEYASHLPLRAPPWSCRSTLLFRLWIRTRSPPRCSPWKRLTFFTSISTPERTSHSHRSWVTSTSKYILLWARDSRNLLESDLLCREQFDVQYVLTLKPTIVAMALIRSTTKPS